MFSRFLELAMTPAVKEAQRAEGSRALYERIESRPVGGRELTQREIEFIALRDSFYMATVSETGWPYVQHRGGPRGFLQVLDGGTLAFPDYRGNRQYLSLGNLAHDDRVAMILVDYPNRRRLKILGHARSESASDQHLRQRMRGLGSEARVERLFVITVEGYDWNCPQHITPRFSAEELKPLFDRLERLEAENRQLRENAGASPAAP